MHRNVTCASPPSSERRALTPRRLVTLPVRSCVSSPQCDRIQPGDTSGGFTQSHPLSITEAEIYNLPEVDFPPGHIVYHVASLTDLPSSSLSVAPLLFPATATDGGSSGEAIVGFDVEWRAHISRAEAGTAGRANSQHEPISPATVVQLSSAQATVVVNLYALGVSMGEMGSVREACAAALLAVKPVFADAALVKVGLQCDDDLARLRQLCRGFQASNVVDCQV
jgi:hypothetical protein